MKKIISTITVVIYFAVSCGIMVNFHYCMDRYASFQLYGSSDEKCDLCGMHTDENGCCRDEIKILKLEDDQRTAEVVFSFYEVASPEIIPSKFIDTDFYTVPVPDLFNNHSPPLITQQDTYLQNCVFRI